MWIDFEKGGGLVPVIVQNVATRQVVMLGYMNAEALAKTQEEKRIWFYSRSKKRLWLKGETSGHFLWLKKIRVDCDGDALLLEVEPQGNVCHLDKESCFYD
jgi:phosphoribosyl-AMP cyclohydrolase / phosphoribosyl-ATP pyrophosphohydrolase